MKKFILLILKFLKKNFHQQKQKKQYLNTFLILEKQLEILTKHKTDYEGDFPRTKDDLFNTWSIDEALDLSFKLLGTKNEIINKRLVRFSLSEYSNNLFLLYSWITYLPQKIILFFESQNIDNQFFKQKYFLDKAILEKNIREIIINSFILVSLESIRLRIRYKKFENIPIPFNFPLTDWLWLRVFIDTIESFNIFDIGERIRLINNLKGQIESDTNTDIDEQIRNIVKDQDDLWDEVLVPLVRLLEKEIILSQSGEKFKNRADGLIHFYGEFFPLVIGNYLPPYPSKEESLQIIKRYQNETGI